MYYGTYTCTKVPVGTTHIHYTEVPVGTTEILLVQKYPQVLQSKYRGTLRYYRTYTEVLVGTFRSLLYSFLYSYSLFRVLSYNCWIADELKSHLCLGHFSVLFSVKNE